MTEFSLTSME